MLAVMQNATLSLAPIPRVYTIRITGGYAIGSTPGYFLEAHTRFFSLEIGYLNRIARAVWPCNIGINRLFDTLSSI